MTMSRLAMMRKAASQGKDLRSVSPKANVPVEPKMLPVSSSRVPKLNTHTNVLQNFVLSEEQERAKNAIVDGGSCCVVGVAGAGKTAVLVSAILEAVPKHPPILMKNAAYYRDQWQCDPEHKYLQPGNPGIVLIAFTRSAARNLANRLPPNYDYVYKDPEGDEVPLGNIKLRGICMTFHKLLQWRLQDKDLGEITSEDADTDGKEWAPYRRNGNFLPPELTTFIIDEATLPSIALMKQLIDAIHPSVKISLIVTGDLFQIQSVGGMSALAAFSTFMQAYTLTHCYRFDGAIINTATDIRKQRTEYIMPGQDLMTGSADQGRVRRITYGVRNPEPGAAMDMIARYLSKGILAGTFIPGMDLAICFHDPIIQKGINKFGITTLYRKTQQLVDEARGTMTHFIRTSSRNKHGGVNAVLLAAGDVVAADFSDSRSMFMILRVNKSPSYKGKIYPPMRYSTRDPSEWLDWARAAESQHDGSLIEAAMRQHHDDWEDFDEHLAAARETEAELESGEFSNEEGSGSVGRKATHYVYAVDLQQLQVEIASRTNSGADAELLLEHVIKRLDYAARLLDYRYHVQGMRISDDDFERSIRDLMTLYGLEEVFDDALLKVTRGSEFKDISPWFLTGHKVQGLSGRYVVVATHGDIPAFTEYVYTGCTRAREMLTVFSHSAFWGLPSEELVADILSGAVVHPDVSKSIVAKGKPEHVRRALSPNWRSDVHSAQIKGVTIPAKVDNIQQLLNEGKGGVTNADLIPFKKRLFDDPNYMADQGWRNLYEDS